MGVDWFFADDAPQRDLQRLMLPMHMLAQGGITEEELEFAKAHGRDRLLELLEERAVFPYTAYRASIPLPPSKSKSSFWRF